jgi:hypothetical protein
VNDSLSAEIAAAAARLVVEAGMEYGPAKRKAARMLGQRTTRAALPDNDAVEDEVRTYLELFHADTQPAELAALRAVAAQWMEQLAEFRPHLTGAVWRGTATRLSNIHLQLFCDDSKAAEIALINRDMGYEVESHRGPRGNDIDLLLVSVPCPALGERVTLCLSILDHDDLRGALRPDARGRAQRGDLAALRRMVESVHGMPP